MRRVRAILDLFLSRLLVISVIFITSGCRTFESEWKKAGEASAGQEGISGRWKGVWLSDANGHTGELRCLLVKKDDGNWKARFHAKYQKFFSFGYSTQFTMVREGDEYNFQGEADLGWLAGGHYHYEGTANPTNFFSTYSSKYDHGTFRMGRPPQAAQMDGAARSFR